LHKEEKEADPWSTNFMVTTLAFLVLTCGLVASVVFAGVSLNSRLMGKWRVVELFGADISKTSPPFTLELVW